MKSEIVRVLSLVVLVAGAIALGRACGSKAQGEGTEWRALATEGVAALRHGKARLAFRRFDEAYALARVFSRRAWEQSAVLDVCLLKARALQQLRLRERFHDQVRLCAERHWAAEPSRPIHRGTVLRAYDRARLVDPWGGVTRP